MENSDKSEAIIKSVFIYGIYLIFLSFLVVKFIKKVISILEKCIEPHFAETAQSTLIISIIFIILGIILCVFFNLFYFSLIHKYIYKNIYDTSPFLTLITGIYTTSIAMLNIFVFNLNVHNEKLKKDIPAVLDKWNNFFFITFLFLVICSITLNYLKSKNDIKEKKLKEQNKHIIYSRVESFESKKNEKSYYINEIQKKYDD